MRSISKWVTRISAGIGALLLALLAPNAQAAPIPLAFISYDVNIPGNFAQFDVVNLTGPNSFPPSFPVTNTALFDQSSLSLSVNFTDGSTRVFGSSYFTLDADGESLDGSPIAIGGANPLPNMATLTGDLLTTVLDTPNPTSVDAAFDTAVITDSPNLVDGDLAIINAEPAGTSVPVPEPDMTLTMFMVGLMAMLFAGWRRRRQRPTSSALAMPLTGAVGALILAAAMLAPGNAFADTSVKQLTLTSPQTGVAGVSLVNITALGVPAAGILPGDVTIKLAPTCTVGATSPVAGEVDATADKVTSIVGGVDRFNFSLPSALVQGTYFAQLVDPTDGFDGGNCSLVMVTNTTAALNACVPTSSLGVVTGTKVVAYVPNGRWDVSNTGVIAVPIEGGGTNTSIPTLNAVNSCAGNPATGQVVCTGNNTDVYLISGNPPALNTSLTSNLTGAANFSGGSCTNCGVAINALSNTAAIQGGLTGSPSGNGVTILNLSNNTFNPPTATRQIVSEDISIDPGRGLILSPNEGNNYMLLQQNSAGAITAEFDRSFVSGGDPDSAAEDCATGIALSSVEFTNNVYAADLTQGTFTPGSPGSWTSPQSLFSLTGVPGFSAGISGISVAQGASHLAFVTGEFGGNTAGILQLQSASGTGGSPPTLGDFVAWTMPPTPSGPFAAGCDPHTMTAYTSPNTGKAIALYTSYNTTSCANPNWIGVIDMAAALTATRTAGTHTIAPSVNLITSGIVTYVKIQ
jgi:hypothetical protein